MFRKCVAILVLGTFVMISVQTGISETSSSEFCSPLLPVGWIKYPPRQKAAKNGDNVRVFVKDTKTIPGQVGIVEVWCDASEIGGSSHEPMYDDGNHEDGVAGDDIWGSNEITVNAPSGRHWVYIYIKYLYPDPPGPPVERIYKLTIPAYVDNNLPVIHAITVIYPLGQTAVKVGDELRLLLKATDGEIPYVPTGISVICCNAATLGCQEYEGMYDDGRHDDGIAGDDWYGTNLLTIRVMHTSPTTITVKIGDWARNWVWRPVIIPVDNTLPVVSNVTIHYPDGKNSAGDGEFIYVSASISDSGLVNGIAKVTADTRSIGGDSAVFMNDKGTPPDAIANDGVWTSARVMVSTKNVTGKFAVRINALDIAYNLKSQTGNVVIENLAPTLAITQPDFGDYVKGVVEIKVRSESTISNKLVVEYRIDISDWREMSGKPPTWSAHWRSTEVKDGWHTLTVRSTDPAGHVSQKSIGFTVDNTPPDISWHSIPKDGAHVRGIVPISVCAKDLIGVKFVNLTIDGKTLPIFKNLTSQLYECELRTFEFTSDKTHTIIATATDYLDQVATIKSTIFVDNLQPKISLTVKEGLVSETQSGNIILCITISDSSEIDKVFIRIDKKEWVQVNKTAGVYEYKWITTHKDNGKHMVEVKAIDILGNANIEQYQLLVENSDFSWISFFIIMIVFLLVIGILAFVGRKKRKVMYISQFSIPASTPPLRRG